MYNDKYEINIVTLICPKHRCDVVHHVSIKGGIKRWCLCVVRAERPCPFEPWLLTKSVAAVKGTTSPVWSLNRLLMAHG